MPRLNGAKPHLTCRTVPTLRASIYSGCYLFNYCRIFHYQMARLVMHVVGSAAVQRGINIKRKLVVWRIIHSHSLTLSGKQTLMVGSSVRQGVRGPPPVDVVVEECIEQTWKESEEQGWPPREDNA